MKKKTTNFVSVILTVPRKKSTATQLVGCKSWACNAVGHHHSMRHNRRLDCHMNVNSLSFAMYPLTGKLVSHGISIFSSPSTLYLYYYIGILVGRGKSKKEAKRIAANQMWQQLQNLPLDSPEENVDDVSDTRGSESLFFFLLKIFNFPYICGQKKF